MAWLLLAAALFVAFSNGANDNFKGFATVWGSGTLTYRHALTLATLATAAGSVVSLMLAESLLQHFSGKGLVPDTVVSNPIFLTGVAASAAFTVLLATRFALPISTTHALIGALVGAGLAQQGGEVYFSKLAAVFLLPLLASPLLAALLGALAERISRLRQSDKDCACVSVYDVVPAHAPALVAAAVPRLVIASAAACDSVRASLRLSISANLDRLHVASAMSICFARALNDTPKLAALLIAAHLVDAKVSHLLVAAAMGMGGVLFSRRVAVTMSQRVTQMDNDQGLAANLITAVLVLFASKLGVPVSTTHVSVGAIAGVGASARTLDWHALRNVALSWVATLPLSAVLAWSVVAVLERI